jgi:O-antigen ligase
MQKLRIVRYAAAFWGLATFMPVGMNYLAAFILLLAVLVQGQARGRIARLRGHAMWWPAVVFVGWTLVVLALQPTYPETPSNLWHGLRIVATLALALCLARDEAVWGLRGFLMSALWGAAVVGLHLAIGLPEHVWWNSLIHLSGNKSIANAVMFSLIAASGLVLALDRPGIVRYASVLIAVILLAIPVWLLPSRTSLLIVLITLTAGCVHQLRDRWLLLTCTLTVAVALAFTAYSSIPNVKQRFAQGLAEVESAQAGKVSQESWGIRVNMYRHTLQMMLDRPVAGWGIGAWNTQWRARVPPILQEFNMPHNDFLWMGAQAGIPGAMSLLTLLVSALWAPWRRSDLTGRLAMTAVLTVILTSTVNSGMRDAAIGLSLLWVTGLYLRLVSEPTDGTALLLPTRAMHRPRHMLLTDQHRID